MAVAQIHGTDVREFVTKRLTAIGVDKKRPADEGRKIVSEAIPRQATYAGTLAGTLNLR